jgi:4-aminobutyrate aminotransferase-like enzyme
MLPELRTEIPGPESRSLAAELRRYESRNITFINADFPIFWERADGVNVWDVDGNRFLDLTSAFAVAGLGHNAPAVVEAMRDQSTRLLHAMGDVHPTRAKAELCRLLSGITFERWGAGTGRTILANSGSEAVEAALKTALLHTGRAGVLSFKGGYHGLGHGALETIGIPFFREPFRAQLGRFGVQAPYPTRREQIDDVRTQIVALLDEHEIGAVLVEPVQGRGGEIVPPEEFLTRATYCSFSTKFIPGSIARDASSPASTPASCPI